MIDETDLLEETLKPRVESINGTIEKIQLTGNHLTPCIQVHFHHSFFGYCFEVFGIVTSLRAASNQIYAIQNHKPAK